VTGSELLLYEVPHYQTGKKKAPTEETELLFTKSSAENSKDPKRLPGSLCSPKLLLRNLPLQVTYFRIWKSLQFSKLTGFSLKRLVPTEPGKSSFHRAAVPQPCPHKLT
jgi:hypothetical protein